MDRHQYAVTGADLHAYVDGQLDPERRVEVEAHLAAHPDEAARVMEGLRLRGELRLFLAGEAEEAWPPAPETVAMGRRLARALRLRVLLPRLWGGVAAACLVGLGVGLGWMGHAELGGFAGAGAEVAASPAEVLADDAAQAWHVARLEPEAPGPAGAGPPPTPVPDVAAPDPAPLPGGLQRVGADVMPWEGGTAAVELLVTPGGDELVLLTAETPTPGLERPETETADGVTTVSWRRGRYAYALSGDMPAPGLLSLALSMTPRT